MNFQRLTLIIMTGLAYNSHTRYSSFVFSEVQTSKLFTSSISFDRIAGTDEAGAGALAGPVSAAAVILREEYDWTFLRDSKALTPQKRCDYSAVIEQNAVSYCVVFVSHLEIDRVNILNARMIAMKHALQMLTPRPLLALIDGNRIPYGLTINARALVDGDSFVPQISAASILAKVARDELMARLSNEFCCYGFDKHFGYPTALHKDRLIEHGYCKIHRKTYAPIIEASNASHKSNTNVSKLL